MYIYIYMYICRYVYLNARISTDFPNMLRAHMCGSQYQGSPAIIEMDTEFLVVNDIIVP